VSIAFHSVLYVHTQIPELPYFSIDNANMPTSGRYRQRTEDFFKSTCVASSNIELDEEFFGF
jgi:hypothetical protein